MHLTFLHGCKRSKKVELPITVYFNGNNCRSASALRTSPRQNCKFKSSLYDELMNWFRYSGAALNKDILWYGFSVVWSASASIKRKSIQWGRSLQKNNIFKNFIHANSLFLVRCKYFCFDSSFACKEYKISMYRKNIDSSFAGVPIWVNKVIEQNEEREGSYLDQFYVYHLSTTVFLMYEKK